MIYYQHANYFATWRKTPTIYMSNFNVEETIYIIKKN